MGLVLIASVKQYSWVQLKWERNNIRTLKNFVISVYLCAKSGSEPHWLWALTIIRSHFAGEGDKITPFYKRLAATINFFLNHMNTKFSCISFLLVHHWGVLLICLMSIFLSKYQACSRYLCGNLNSNAAKVWWLFLMKYVDILFRIF